MKSRYYIIEHGPRHFNVMDSRAVYTNPDDTGAYTMYADPVVATATSRESAEVRRDHMERAYQQGRHDAVSELRTSDEVATELGISRRAVQYRAAKLGVGWQVGPRAILFRPEDVEALRNAPLPGRPKRG